MKRKFYKSKSDKMFFGVLGGFAEYKNINSTAVRVVYSLLAIFTAILPLLIVYILFGIFLKEDPMVTTNYKDYLQNEKEKRKRK